MSVTVRERARKVLKATGWTQSMLAQELGVEQPTVSRILGGAPTTRPVVKNLERVEEQIRSLGRP